MKTYDIRFTSTYDYSAPAQHGFHMVRLLPAMRADQEVQLGHLDIDPGPALRQESRDFFDNQVHAFAIEQPHDALVLTMQARVCIARQANMLAAANSQESAWEDVARLARASRDLGPHAPAHFIAPTPATIATTPLRIFAARFFTPGRSLTQAARELASVIGSELAYESDVTSVETTAVEAFALGAGVCQDFAHIMLATCRCMGIPARYVTGYIRTDPPPGKPRLEGADAMHAWVSVWCGPQGGWVDYDPTNGCAVLDDHIIVAQGRDHQDTAPVRGEVLGAGSQSHDVAVDVIETTS